jgi:tetratricopeptide (TPR) repeat protein
LVRLDNGRSALERVAESLIERESLIRIDGGRLVQQKEDLFGKIIANESGKRAIEFIAHNIPMHVGRGSHSRFLTHVEVHLPELAEIYYKRALATFPDDADILDRYALFLRRQLQVDRAESVILKAISAEPTARRFYEYALFLEEKGEMEKAVAYCRKALSAESSDVSTLGNVGQIMVRVGDAKEGYSALLAAFEKLDSKDTSNAAELSIALWFAARFQDMDASIWERRFKFLSTNALINHRWDFSRLIERGRQQLSDEDAAYGEAMAAEFNKQQPNNLNSFERWRRLKPLDPRLY